MDLSYFTLFVVISVVAVLSLTVWMAGLLIRKRLRGPGRVIIMTMLLIMWYVTLYPLISGLNMEESTRRAYEIGIHSIWIWWVWALMRFFKRARRKAIDTDWKTGVYTATGMHRVTTEVRKLREKRRAEKARELGAAESDFTPDV
jgi:hypothetical protein